MALREVLQSTGHRPYPLPIGSWLLTQWWDDLLFAHWPLPPAEIEPFLPPSLEPDVLDNQAWVAVVPFRMRGVRVHALPPYPFTANFLELNLRTYVRPRGRQTEEHPPGVYFWSLDANAPLAVWGARTLFHLNYLNANMSAPLSGGATHYQSKRTHAGYPAASLDCLYEPIPGPYSPTELDRWLTERYCLYTTDSRGHLYRGDIHHLPWTLKAAQASFYTNTLANAAGLNLPNEAPHLLYSRSIQVAIWPLRKLS
ncbi:MAG: DUF2071 domain-containing protein [Bryobacter sp.]|nr:DUF2071 domain-containing protein [Bryobacter sp.]